MATLSTHQPPNSSSAMTSRRAPLANVPNAINSPFRSVAATNGKRTRAQAGDGVYGQPPAKKQVIEIPDDNEENIDPRRKNLVALAALEKLEEPFSKRSNTQPTAFERKLAASREKKPAGQPQPKEKPRHKQDAEGLESLKQWCRHYRKQFPSYVLYFDSVPDDVRSKTLKQINSLGAREEKFFSNAVTHVVTTRPVPKEPASTSPDEDDKAQSTQQKVQGSTRTANLLEAHLQRRTQTQAGTDKAQSQASDILSRARQLGIKIWALEKLHRMLDTILDPETYDQATAPDTRVKLVAKKAASKPAEDADLELLLRNEKINGPADRDMTVAAQDMCTFKGYYLYIHDMDERTKPVMVRDYPKPSSKEGGKWPQFHVSGPGRCPFVNDPALARQQKQEAADRAQEELATAQRKTRAASALQTGLARGTAPPRALTDRQPNLRRSPRKLDTKPEAVAKPLDPPRGLPAKRQSSTEGMPAVMASAQPSLRGLPRMIGGEPMASGIQHSNVTSAIRSQYISSAAISSTAPGANYRVGDSKDVAALKRKVLIERGASAASGLSMPSSHLNDIRAAINNDNEPPPRAAKRKAQETLGVLHEDDEDGAARQSSKHRKPAPKRRKPVEKDPKPGYCENCRDKYEDFDEHILSRKHRKFATTQSNWKELDDLLGQLRRPHKVA